MILLGAYSGVPTECIRHQSTYAVTTWKFLCRWKVCRYIEVTLKVRSYHMFNFEVMNLAVNLKSVWFCPLIILHSVRIQVQCLKSRHMKFTPPYLHITSSAVQSKTQYVYLKSIVDTSTKRKISLQTTSMLKSCICTCLIYTCRNCLH